MIYVKGRRNNLVSVGWENHTLQVEFKGGRRYVFGGVPAEVKDKLLRSPYPDSLFQKIVRGKYVSERACVQSQPVPPPAMDDLLPF
jgi:hypothetical protein